MRCPRCGVENKDGSSFCKECGLDFSSGETDVTTAEPTGEETSPMARFLTVSWSRRGPILMSLFVVLLMAMVFAPYAFIKLEVIGISLVSRTFDGWEIFIPRILFFLSIIPLIVSLLMTAGIGSRRLVIETHICTFFGGVMFTIWLITFALSEVLKAVLRNIDVLSVNISAGQIFTIIFFIGFMFGIVVTSYDRGRKLASARQGG